MRCCAYVRKKTSKSSNMTKVTLQEQFVIISLRTYDSNCAFMLHCAQMSRWFVYVIDCMIILTFFHNTDSDAVFFCCVCH